MRDTIVWIGMVIFVWIRVGLCRYKNNIFILQGHAMKPIVLCLATLALVGCGKPARPKLDINRPFSPDDLGDPHAGCNDGSYLTWPIEADGMCHWEDRIPFPFPITTPIVPPDPKANETNKLASKPKNVAEAPCLDGASGGGGDGYYTYECRSGQVVDTTEKTRTYFEAINKERHELLLAMRTRLLTEEETKKIIQLDWHLMEDESLGWQVRDSDYETRKRQQFNDVLLQQFKIQRAVKNNQEVCP